MHEHTGCDTGTNHRQHFDETAKMTNKKFLCIAAILAATSSAGWAKDAVKASVSEPTGTPILQENGNSYSPGTYAVGTIQLTYTVVGYTFPAGSFGGFDVDWEVVTGYASGGTTNYGSPINLTLDQVGGSNIDLSPTPNSFSVPSSAANGHSRVGIAISPSVAADPTLNCDGCTLVGNLRLSATQGAKLDTPTNIQVKLVLAHPDACLKAYHFITAQDAVTPLTSTQIKIATKGSKAGTVASSNPGQYSENVMIANTCPTDESFDLRIQLDNAFETNPSNNPGNAVFTYSSAGEVDQGNFGVTNFGTGTAQGQQLCLQNVTVPADTTFLATVHSQVKKGGTPDTLPSDGTFDFSATLFDAVNGGCTGDLKPAVTISNPAELGLPFTLTN